MGGVDPHLRINWKKFEIMGEVIVSMQRAQGAPHSHFIMNDAVRGLIGELELLRDEDVSIYMSSSPVFKGTQMSRKRLC